MKMVEALEWAADYAERTKIFVAPTNRNGYVKDGWKEPTAEEKVAIITKIAREVVDEIPISGEVIKISDFTNLCAHGAILCAPCGYIPDTWRQT